MTVDELGHAHTWVNLFDEFRRQKRQSVRQQEEDFMLKPIPYLNTKASAKMKRERVRREKDRLVTGFTASSEPGSNWMKSLISVPSWQKSAASLVSIPSWQKSTDWVDPSHCHDCFRCNVSFKMTFRNFMAKKINCCICGQVYCSECTKNEMIIYLLNSRSTTAQWAINGKTGTPATTPYSCVLLPVCMTCDQELGGNFN